MSESIEIKFNPDELTLGDLEDFQGYVGRSLDDELKPVFVRDEDGKKAFDERGRPEMEVKLSAKALVALTWLTKRKEDPAFTVDAARNVRVSAMAIVAAEDENQGND